MTHERTEEADVVRAEVKRVIEEAEAHVKKQVPGNIIASGVRMVCNEILRRLGLEEKGGN